MKNRNRGYYCKVTTQDGEHKKVFRGENAKQEAYAYVDELIELGYQQAEITIEDNDTVWVY